MTPIYTAPATMAFYGMVGVSIVIVVLNVKATGSAEIVVTAVSTSDPSIYVEAFLGRTIGDVMRMLEKRGYTLAFVTNPFFVCTKYTDCSTVAKKHRVTLFNVQKK